MSRRKQSNPKPIKHEDSEEDTGRRSGPGAQSDNMATASPSEETDSTGHESRGSDCHTNDIQECPLKTDVLYNDVDIAARPESDWNNQGSGDEDSTSQEKPLKECCSSHLSIKSEMLSDSHMRTNGSNDNGTVHISTDHCDLPNNRLEPIIKRELSASPNNEGKGDSDEGPVHHGHSVTPNYKLSNKSKRRKRSRSRSSSKSVGVPCSPDAPPTSSQSREEAERALVNQLQLPSDVLYLRQQEMTIQGIPSIGWVVCCAIPLPQGSSLGPFQGQLVPPDAVKVGDLIVQFTNKKGQQALMNVAGETGGWLALLRSAPAKTERNTHVYWEGGRIWCEVVADIEIGTELRATFSFQSDDDNEDDGDDEAASTSETKHTDGSSSEDTAASVQQIQHPYQQQVAPGHAALIYGCPFCGVRFSSPRTLQGHLSFYCSKKTSDHMVTPVSKDRDKGASQSRPQIDDLPMKQEPSLRQDADSPPGTRAPTDSDSQAELDVASSASQAKVGRPGQVFKCKHCSYKADKLSSLNRHMRMHNNDKVRVISFSPGERVPCSMSENLSGSTRSPNSETFCKECKIQFSNLHTFKCHKEHYCTQRRKKALADPSAFAAMFHSPFSFHDPSKIGVPSALQMAALNQGGLILPQSSHDASGQASASLLLSTPVLTASGVTSIAISLPTMLVPPMVGGQDVAAVATSPRSKGSGDKQQPSLTSSQHHLPLTHFLNISSTSQTDYTRTLGELHKSKEFLAPKLDSLEEEHPLDLTTTRKRLEPEHDARKDEIQTFSTFLQPDRDGALDARRICSPSQTCGSSGAGLQPRDLQDNPNCPPHSPGLYGLSRNDSVEVKREAHSTGPLAVQPTVRSDHMPPSSMIVQVLPHPSILVSPAGFLSVPLTLSPPDKRSAPLSPSGSANGISKCADCNIVFYKHDNYVIHKKHYCSGKRRVGPQVASTADSAFFAAETDTKPEPDIPQPQTPPLSQSPPLKCNQDLQNEFASSADTLPDLKSSPHKHSSEVKYKFYCVPCRIKFSNSSILEAHKEYYCPAGKDSEQSVIVQTSSMEAIPVASPKDDREHTSPDSPAEEFTCPRCSSIFVSARLLRLHVCDGGFPCPHCEHVSITENRLAEHLKVHAPTKAYRCTICGYRGNTARGMRMHGKSHIDEGLDFTDENMLAYHEPALIPVDHSPYPGAASDTELLRLKNEPYKRRRSRKAYEKFDYPLPKVDIPQTCPLCGQNFASADHLASHFKVHEIAASQYITGLMKCIQCGFIGKSLESLRSHYESHHRANSRNKRPRLSSPDSEDQSQSRRITSPGVWRSPRQSASDHNEGHGSTTDKKPSLKESQKNTEFDPHSFGNDERQQAGTSAQHVTIKNEPTDEEKHDLDSACKLNHFLQTPNQSPLSDSPNDLDTKEQSSSPSVSSSRAWSASLSNSTQQEDHQPGCADSGRPSSATSKMETEPGEISTAGIKHEPRYEDEQMDLSAQFYPLKDPKLDSSSAQKADHFDLDAGAASNKPYIKQEKAPADLPRSSFPSPYVARRDASSSPSAMTTPNFLVRSPPNKSSSHSPVEQSANARLPPSSSFQTSKSSAATSSLTAIFPLQSVQGQTVSFPCTTPQLSLPYLFLPPIQATSSVPIPCSPSLPDDRISGARYCQNCDISFSKHATYLAHKKYYCTARPRGEVQSSAKA